MCPFQGSRFQGSRAHRQGDVLICLSPANWSCVAGLSMLHPYPGSGRYKLDAALQERYQSVQSQQPRTGQAMNPKITTFYRPSDPLSDVSTKIRFGSSLLSPTPKPSAYSSTISTLQTETSRPSHATASAESREHWTETTFWLDPWSVVSVVRALLCLANKEQIQ